MASEAWPTATLSDLVDIRHGFAFDGHHFSENPNGLVLLTPGNVAIGGGFQQRSPKYFHGPIPQEFVFDAGDLFVSMTDLSKSGDTLGYPAFVPAARGTRYLHNQRLGKVILKSPDELELGYLYCFMRSDRYRREVLADATGTTVRHTSPTRLGRIVIPLPPLKEQREIATVLLSLDQKTEINRRMNQSLEQIAQALFKSWFVDFDPVHAKADGRWKKDQSLPGMPAGMWDLWPSEFEESEIGEIPKGWTTGTLGQFVESLSDRVEPTAAKDEERYIALDDMPSNSVALTRSRKGTEVNSSIVRFQKGDVLFGAMRPYFHKVGLAQFGGITRSTTFVLRPRSDDLRGFALFAFAREEVVGYATDSSVGTTIPYVHWGTLSEYPFVVPPPRFLRKFNSIVKPIMDNIGSRGAEGETLSIVRDALLPKLLSGEIRVSTSGTSP